MQEKRFSEKMLENIPLYLQEVPSVTLHLDTDKTKSWLFVGLVLF